MAEMEPTENSLMGEAFHYTLHNPIKVLANTAILAWAVHSAREWKGPLTGYFSRQFESWRQDNVEE